jgi:hypothetical protein
MRIAPARREPADGWANALRRLTRDEKVALRARADRVARRGCAAIVQMDGQERQFQSHYWRGLTITH